MAKRRTKKQKKEAKHQISISWKPDSPQSGPEAKKNNSKASVKGQFKKESYLKIKKNNKTKSAVFLAKGVNLASYKHDLIKSVVIASLILSLEVVLYLFR